VTEINEGSVDGVVRADVKIIPAKRKATYDVPIDPANPKRKITATVNVRDVAISGPTRDYPTRVATIPLPKTLEAIDNLVALLGAVRAELIEQGVEE
jgi:hypothetical protein